MDKKITINDIYEFKACGKKVAVVACYDYATAHLVAQADVESVLVGDSAAQVLLGFNNTLPATMDFMVTITSAVRRAAPNLFLIADMPFLSYSTSAGEAIKNAGRFVVECGADIVKFEAGQNDIETIKAVANANIPVMAHIGIRPQMAVIAGKLKAAGTTLEEADRLAELAQKMVEAGAKMLLLEGVATQTAEAITKASPIPVISCGSGVGCDGQVLIVSDILALMPDRQMPKFAKSFGNVGLAMLDALKTYSREVHDGKFPDDAHSYHLKA